MKWIKHDTNANQDNKLQNVLLDYGLEGYGLYWYCLELIGSKVDKENITFELEHDARVIARNVGSTAQKVEEMMRYFVDQGLFQETDNIITCLAMAKRLDKSMTSNSQMREIIGSLSMTSTVKEGYVYFIENTDNDGNLIEIKIGRSANPHARFAEHQKKYSEFGFNLALVHTIKSDDCVSLETEIHRKLNDYKVRKEWFSACNEALELLRHDYGLTTSCKNRLDKNRLDKNKDLSPSGSNRLPPVPYQKIIDLYHEKTNLPRVAVLSDKRKRSIKARWKEELLSDLEAWGNYFDYVASTPFLNGVNDRGWTADFDFLIKPETPIKCQEGKYSNEIR